MEALFQTWFTNAVASTFVVAVILASIGGLCAFLLRSHVPDAEAVADGAPATDGGTRAGAVAQTGDA